MRKVLLALAVISAFSSCRLLRPSLLLKTPPGYVFESISDSMAELNYHIAPTDAISFRILSNEGFKLVDINSTNTNIAISTIETTVELNGYVKLPLIGRVK